MDIRNIAIIAHVDHGKTTMVDKLLRATDAFRANQQVEDRVLDSNDQERERGITILAKNISIEYKDVKINVIDTPGHADFGGEVERVLRMADGALLLVDAFEGPMPQTRFVLRHAIDTGLKIMIVINKIDRPGANPEKAYNDCLDLMADLGATDDQLEFAMEHVVYASAMNGFARLDPNDGNMDMYPLLDMIIDDMPAPEVDENAPLAMQCVTIDHSNFVGRIGIGRVYSGTIHQGDQILVVKNDGSSATATVKQLFTFDYLGRTECQEVGAGDIAAVVGIDRTDIGDVYTDPENPVELEPIEIELHKELTEAEYDAFANALLEDRDWLAGLGGHANGRRRVVAVSAPGRTTVFVDPSGSRYGRYVGIAEAPVTDDDQAGAIGWLIDNRRPEVSREQAIRTLRRALAGDPAASRILDRLAEQ